MYSSHESSPPSECSEPGETFDGDGDSREQYYDGVGGNGGMLLSNSQHNRILQWTNSLQQQQQQQQHISQPPFYHHGNAGSGMSSQSPATEWDAGSESSGAVLLDLLQELDSVQLAQLYLRASEAAEAAEIVASDVAQGDDDDDGVAITDGGGAMGAQRLAETIAAHLRRRDKELELAARAGQELLARNAALAADLSLAAAERDALEQQSCQLRHDIVGKERLLRAYMSELSDMQDSAESSPRLAAIAGNGRGGDKGARLRRLSSPMDPPAMESYDVAVVPGGVGGSVCDAEVEMSEAGRQLAQHMLSMQQQARDMERREREIIAECVRQVKDTADDVRDLHEKTSEREVLTSEHSAELSRLREQNSRLEHSHDRLVREKQDLQGVLLETRSKQDELSSQVSDLQAQYMECVGLFREASKELSLYRRHTSFSRIADLAGPEEGEPRQPQQQTTITTTTGAAAAMMPSLSQELETANRHVIATPAPPPSPVSRDADAGGRLDRPSVTATVAMTPARATPAHGSHAPYLASQSRHHHHYLQHRTPRHQRTPKPDDASNALKAATLLRDHAAERAKMTAAAADGDDVMVLPGTRQRLVLRTPLYKKVKQRSDVVGLSALLPPATPAAAVRGDDTASPSASSGEIGSRAPGRVVATPTVQVTSTTPTRHGDAIVASSAASPVLAQPKSARRTIAAGAAPSPLRSAPSPGGGGVAVTTSLAAASSPSGASPLPSPTSQRRSATTSQSSPLSSSLLFGRATGVQMVKPMEGSMTLLKWHLLAMQQTSDSMAIGHHLPGIHVKTQQAPGAGGGAGGGVFGRGDSAPGSGNASPSTQRSASPSTQRSASPAVLAPAGGGRGSTAPAGTATGPSQLAASAAVPATTLTAAPPTTRPPGSRRIISRGRSGTNVAGAVGLGGLLDAV